jgi:DNA polymerase III alpha subunit
LPESIIPGDRLVQHEDRKTVEIAGLVVARQRPGTAKGFVFILLEDETGMMNVIVRPDVFERYRAVVRGEPLLLVKGVLAKDDGALNVLAEEITALECGMRSAECGVEPLADSALRTPHSAFAFLKTMRRVAPDSKDWG